MTNVYDQANALESALRQSDEFLQMQDLYKKVNEDETSKKLFDEIRELQMTLQQKQMQGQEITDDDIKAMRELTDQLSNYSEIQNLMEKEQKMNSMMDELNKIISKPIAEIYQDK